MTFSPTQRQGIIDDLVTKLTAIRGGPTYRTSVTTVEYGIKSWEQAGAALMPWIGVATAPDQDERPAHEPAYQMRVVLPVLIVAHVLATTVAQKVQMLADLVDDILAAVESDTTRAGNATQTTWVSAITDEGDPFVATTSSGGSGTLEMRFEVTYERTTRSSP